MTCYVQIKGQLIARLTAFFLPRIRCTYVSNRLVSAEAAQLSSSLTL